MAHFVPQDGLTALMLASDGGHTDIVQQLLSSGAKVDLQSKVRHDINLSLVSKTGGIAFMKSACLPNYSVASVTKWTQVLVCGIMALLTVVCIIILLPSNCLLPCDSANLSFCPVRMAILPSCWPVTVVTLMWYNCFYPVGPK